MTQDATRQSLRIPYAARLLLRGACGDFEGFGLDVSTTGLRLGIEPETLRMDASADLAAAAACVQTRVGSRFAIDLGLSAAGRGRVRKPVELIRLVVTPGLLELGCRFDAPLTSAEAKDLGVAWPRDAHADAEADVRRASSWAEGGRDTLDPAIGANKVERLLDVPIAAPRCRDGSRPRRRLRALLRAAGAGGAAPLVGEADALSEATLRIQLPAEEVHRLGAAPGDFPALGRMLEATYGAWPTLELLDGTRRVWTGAAHPCGLEIDAVVGSGAVVRVAFGRRLQPAELARLVG